MSDHPQDISKRLIDLSSDFAVGDQPSNDYNELNALDADHSVRELFEAAAAQIDAAYAETDPIEMPVGLEDKLMAAIPTDQQQTRNVPAMPQLKLTDDAPVRSQAQVHTSGSPTWFPWMVAAASIVVAGIVLLRPQPAAPVLTLEQQRDQLIAQTDEGALLRYSWTPTDDPAVVGDVTGELVWDEATDQGYMTISGLDVNDPDDYQYQLWIFDATRPLNELPQFAGPFDGLLTQRPIDGGVFDITSTGEVIIPIDPKLLVKQGVAFAVTVERPGGVVVSDRSRVPLLAIPQG